MKAGQPYQLPADFHTDLLERDQLEKLANGFVYQSSLPALSSWLVPDVLALPEDDQVTIVAVLEELRIFEARRNAAAFVEYALTSEQTGDDLVNGDHHNEWHAFLDANPRAVLFAPVEHAKTTHIAVGRVLWTLGRNTSARLAIISNTSAQAAKVLGAVKLHIETNPRLRKVFPDLVPSDRPGDPWHSTAITVRRKTIAKDPSVQALGVTGPLVGSRLDGAILDDVLDLENTRTEEQLQKLMEWYETTLMTRIVAGGWIHVIGTPWDHRDLLHELEKRSGFASKRFSAVLNPSDPAELWQPLWPSQFSADRLRAIYNETTPQNFARKYLCQVQAAETQRFRQEWIDGALHEGRQFQRFPLASLSSGNGRPLLHYTGVDLSMGKKQDSDLVAIFTIAVDDRGRRIVVDIQSGRWTAPEILTRIKGVYDAYQSQILVEDNGAQSFLLQWALDLGVPVKPFTTTSKNKYDERFGVESLAVEVRNGQWVIPSGYSGPMNAEIRAWITDMLHYQPSGHTGDRLMASWFAREGARQHSLGIHRSMDMISRG